MASAYGCYYGSWDYCIWVGEAGYRKVPSSSLGGTVIFFVCYVCYVCYVFKFIDAGAPGSGEYTRVL